MRLSDFVQRLLPVCQRLMFAVVAARKDFVKADQKVMTELVAAAVERRDFVQVDQRLLVEVAVADRMEMVLVRRHLLTVQAAAVDDQMELVPEDSIAVHSELQRRFVLAD